MNTRRAGKSCFLSSASPCRDSTCRSWRGHCSTYPSRLLRTGIKFPQCPLISTSVRLASSFAYPNRPVIEAIADEPSNLVRPTYMYCLINCLMPDLLFILLWSMTMVGSSPYVALQLTKVLGRFGSMRFQMHVLIQELAYEQRASSLETRWRWSNNRSLDSFACQRLSPLIPLKDLAIQVFQQGASFSSFSRWFLPLRHTVGCRLSRLEFPVEDKRGQRWELLLGSCTGLISGPCWKLNFSSCFSIFLVPTGN